MIGGLLALGLLVASCGAENPNNQNRQPLRLMVRLDPGFVDEAYSTTITAQGGIRPYRFSLEGRLPRGLVFNNGRIGGTPQERGVFELTVSVEDANLSSRTQRVTLNIGDTPPPRLDQVFPLAEVADPFPYLFRVRDREARGFQAQIRLRDLQMDNFRADSSLLYVLRYNQERGLLDIDAVFIQPRRDLEAFRFIATPLPERRVRPESSFRETRVAFFDRNGRLAGNAHAIERVAAEGRFRFSDLEAIARNWGRRLTPAPPSTTTPPAPQAPAASTSQPPANSPSQGQTDQQATPSAPTTENQASPPTTSQENPSTTQTTPPTEVTPPSPAQPPQPGQAQPTQPGQAQPTQPGQAQTTPPASAPTAPRLEGDLNSDGVVDRQDLDLLRSSYAWASVRVGPATPPTAPTGPGTPGPGSGNPETPGNPDGR
jgi:hypothetical protein